MTSILPREDESIAAPAPGDALSVIRDLVVARTGLAWWRSRTEGLARLVELGRQRSGVASLDDYLALLSSARGKEAFDALVADLAIGETSFFRHRDQFEALHDVILPKLVERRQFARELRIWSAACSIGAEPASIAISLLRPLPRVPRDWSVSILGTDISHDAVQRARHGVYTVRELRGIPPELRESCFERAEVGWRLRDEFRGLMRFRHHNLVDAAHPDGAKARPFDVILCRNVLIYFDLPTMRRVLQRLHAALAPDGWLLVGHAEPLLSCHDLFEPEWLGSSYAYRPVPASSAVPRLVAERKPPLRVVATESRPAAPATVSPLEALPPNPLDELRRLMHDNQRPAAEAFVRRRVVEAPLDPLTHYCEAVLLEWNAETDRAETALKRCLYLDRDFAMARFRISQILMARGDHGGALRELRNVLKLYGDRPAEETASELDGLTVGGLRDLVTLQLESVGAR